MNLPKLEEKILNFWDEKKIFEKSLEIRQNSPLYSFYDGPPFATGTPHYGHIVASTIKDVVPRYWTMQGYRVERQWGWDCHGLPIENIAEKELGITHKKEIEALGVEKFNQACRSKVLEYVVEWERVIHRLGRWADMKNAYRTMDLDYMETIWWVFKELWQRGLVYEGYHSMHICPRCETTLSQSEVAEGYKMVKDVALIVKFELESEPGTFILAWTTTPWTLIGNVALAVGRDIDYVKISLPDGQYYILARDRLGLIKFDYEIIQSMKGTNLVGLRYKPLFKYYSNDSTLSNHKNGWQIVDASFVSVEEGSGIVHIAPAFGEDDMSLGKERSLPFIQHVSLDGIIKAEAGEFAGMQVKPIDDFQKTDLEIMKYLVKEGLLFSKSKFEHSYPHCWRCETPLLNYATSSWFVAISKIKDQAIDLAKKINWSPTHIKEGRFGKWLEGARDWSISRQRFWASVIPIWRCDKCDESIVVGSAAELQELSHQKITDLHKDKIDLITFSCKKCSGIMRRIPDVLDTWFDSGSMPFAQLHYPFENKEKFKKIFPADFIAEGVDQTRAWFYYLHSIASAIFERQAFKNVIVNGIVLAEDGKKMSKRLQNYPDPSAMFQQYGADVMRYYLLSSPVMQAENFCFNEKEMAEISRRFFRMLWNSYYFFVLYANVDQWKNQKSSASRQIKPKNILDRWIISELNLLIERVNKSMKKYDLARACRAFTPFIDDLSNWFIRRSRKRFWKSENDEDKDQAYQTLYYVLVNLAKLLAPFTPFIAEEIYKSLTAEESVHLADYPSVEKDLIDSDLCAEMAHTRRLVELGLAQRAEHKIKVRQPLQSLTYSGRVLAPELEMIIAEEVNVLEVKQVAGEKESVYLDFKITLELKREGLSREIIRAVQSLRKSADLKISDRILLYYQTESALLKEVMRRKEGRVAKEVLAKEIFDQPADVLSSEVVIEGERIWLGVTYAEQD